MARPKALKLNRADRRALATGRAPEALRELAANRKVVPAGKHKPARP